MTKAAGQAEPAAFPLDAVGRACFVSGMANEERERTGVSEAVGDYLKAIWALGGTEPVSTRDLARQLSVSPPSVSGMLVRLHDLGLVHHERYYGVTLTAEGTAIALRLVRRHRLIETFLVEHLGYSWDEIHDEAEILEHAVSDRFVERLEALLGHPTHDPHGDPIPSPDGDLPRTPNLILSRAVPGSRFRISRLLTQDSDQLSALAALGLKPGVTVEVSAGERTDDSETTGLVIILAGIRHELTRELAGLIQGEEIDS